MIERRSSGPAVFVLSLHMILLELVHTQMLNLKAWNHVVYMVIPLSMLGYGIGANVSWIAKGWMSRWPRDRVLGLGLPIVAALSVLCTLALVRIPVEMRQLMGLLDGKFDLLGPYSVFIVPYVAIGTVMVYAFSQDPARSARLYFIDLVGAAFGAAVFFALITYLEPVRTVVWSSSLLVIVALAGSWRWLAILGPAAILLARAMPEPEDYAVDPAKGIEYLPGSQPPNSLEHLYSRWSALGRTDVYRLLDREHAEDFATSAYGSFSIPVRPLLEYAYSANNYLGGTPIFHLTEERLATAEVRPFTTVMEAPYVLLDRPRTFVIGAGGGRDLFSARLHGAPSIVAAEINPSVFRALAPGGPLNTYNGNQYGQPGTLVVNDDGRHVARTLPAGGNDLVILNGVDTFSGLSSGAYAYAESYLYTREAMVDFLRSLSERGILNYNRWEWPEAPRETLRLVSTAYRALREVGYDDPWAHVIVTSEPTGGSSWAVTLIRKEAFSKDEVARISDYVAGCGGTLVYPTPDWRSDPPPNAFAAYSQATVGNMEGVFEDAYVFDISEVTDDRPFFYKYYRFGAVFIKHGFQQVHQTGTVPYLTQILVFLQALAFIALFLVAPLARWNRASLAAVRHSTAALGAGYFALIGVGFMFVEIPLMQRCVVVLGSPIHSISVTLASLLCAAGLGSLALDRVRPDGVTPDGCVVLSALVAIAMGVINLAGPSLFAHVAGLAFGFRVLAVLGLVAPAGFVLGMYFPSGLRRLSGLHPDLIAWGWAVNGGFSVLGSITAITLAQALGFSTVLGMGAALYLLAALVYRRLAAASPA